jgi:hypothetical protein
VSFGQLVTAPLIRLDLQTGIEAAIGGGLIIGRALGNMGGNAKCP